MTEVYINNIKVTSLVSEITWRYQLYTITGELSFSILGGDYGVGDKVTLKDDKVVIFKGIVTSESGKKRKDLTAFDYGWYLSKNEVIKQFKNARIYDAVRNIADDCQVICELPSTLKKMSISKIYKDEVVSDVIQDLLEHATKTTNYRYYIRVLDNVLVIMDYWGLPVIPIVDIATDYSLGRSIEELYNSVTVVGSDEGSTRAIATAKDTDSVSKYGLLTLVQTIDTTNPAQARQIAKNTLGGVNVISEDFSISCKGSYDLIPGRRVIIKDDELKGEYLITEVSHTFKNDNNYRCGLTLRGWKSFVVGN